MKESSNKRVVIVGLFIFLGLVFLLGGILVVGDLHGAFTKKMRVSAFFEDVNGLQVGNNVWFSGVKIGSVKKIQFFGKERVKVIINVDRDVQDYIRKDAKVKISSDGFIGNKIVVIYGGTHRKAPVLEGDTLGVEQSLSTEDIMSTFQENNVNVLAITNDFKALSKKLVKGEGSLGKFLNDESLYNNLATTSASLQAASSKAQKMMTTLADFSSKLNKKGTLANDLVNDTVVFASMKSTILELNQIADTAGVFMNNLKEASSNSKSPLGIMLHDEETGANLKSTIKNLESSSVKLDQDLEALQHNFLLRGFFKKEAKKKGKNQ
jgi:phospholipid/cholesterol/gamma-HCH transport system substrate-binding protein